MLTPAQRQEFLRAERSLDALTVRRLRALLASMGTPGSDGFIRDLLAALPLLVDELADVSALIGASAYDLSREQSNARGRYAATLAPLPSAEWVQGVAKGALFTKTAEFPDRLPPDLIVQRLEAATPRVVRSGGRETTVVNTERDPARPRYRRVVRAGGCDWCQMLAGRGAIYRSQDSAGASVHFHDNCVIGSTLVGGPNVEVAYRRAYKGEVVVVGLTGGQELTITPNHPVLTARGWVDAGLLLESDQVVVGATSDWASLQVPNEQKVPARIEDVWRSYSVDALVRVPVAPKDFHGDGVGTEGYVDVVSSDRDFSLIRDAVLREHSAQTLATGAGRTSVLAALAALRDRSGVGVGHWLAAHSGMSGFSPAQALVGGQLGGGSFGGLAPPADANARFDKALSYGGSRGTVLLREGQFGRAALVGGDDLRFGQGEAMIPRTFGPGSRFDPPAAEGITETLRVHAEYGGHLRERLSGGVKLLGIRDLFRREYSGHVYNLRTVEGWYEANGLIVSNCGCRIEVVFTGEVVPAQAA